MERKKRIKGERKDVEKEKKNEWLTLTNQNVSCWHVNLSKGLLNLEDKSKIEEGKDAWITP